MSSVASMRASSPAARARRRLRSRAWFAKASYAPERELELDVLEHFTSAERLLEVVGTWADAHPGPPARPPSPCGSALPRP
jgi:hypothetical protein